MATAEADKLQAELDEMIELAQAQPGVAAAMEVYERAETFLVDSDTYVFEVTAATSANPTGVRK